MFHIKKQPLYYFLSRTAQREGLWGGGENLFAKIKINLKLA